MKPIALLIFLALTLQLRGQWATDPTVNNPVCTANEQQAGQVMASDQAGGFIVVWEDERSGSYNYDIYAQRISSSGVPLWQSNGVPVCTAQREQTLPKIISDGNGGAIITWTDFRNNSPGTSFTDIYAQRINAEGVPQWAANGVIVCNATNSQLNPNITTDGNGGAIITWNDERIGNFNTNVYAQHINSEGLATWESNGVLISSDITPRYPYAIVSDESGGAIITWAAHKTDDEQLHIYAQRIDANGSVMGAPNGMPVCIAPVMQNFPQIINSNPGEVIICWVYRKNDSQVDIYAQRLMYNGTQMWADNGAPVCTLPGLKLHPLLIPDYTGGAIITWYDLRSGDYDVYAQRIDVDGYVLWPAEGVPVAVWQNAQMESKLVSDGKGGAIITWVDYRDNNESDIYAQRIDKDGNIQWTDNGIPVCSEHHRQLNPEIMSDGYGGAFITWSDGRAADSYNDIYAQQLDQNGQLGVGASSIEEKHPSASLYMLGQNYPNPFNPKTTITFQLPVGCKVSLKVFDILGNEVAELVNEYKPAGKHEVCFPSEKEIPAPRLTPGVYFYQLNAGGFTRTKKMIFLK